MGNKELTAIKTILNTNKFWGVLMKVNLVELEEVVTFKGYVEDIGYEEEYGDTLICYILFTSSDKGGLKEVLGVEEDVYKWFFPVYKLQFDLDDLAKSMKKNSGGYMEDIKFMEFDTKSEMIQWALTSKVDNTWKNLKE